MKPKKETRGGARPGSGRHKGEPTATISVRVKVRHKETIKKVIKNALKSLD